MATKVECAFKRGHTNKDTLQNEMPPSCKAKGCSGNFIKRKDLCLSFDPVEEGGKIICSWRLGTHKDDVIAETIMRLCDRLKCSGVFERRPKCAEFVDRELSKDDGLLLVVEKKE